jgi:hypothetical protein
MLAAATRFLRHYPTIIIINVLGTIPDLLFFRKSLKGHFVGYGETWSPLRRVVVGQGKGPSRASALLRNAPFSRITTGIDSKNVTPLEGLTAGYSYWLAATIARYHYRREDLSVHARCIPYPAK